MATPRILFLVLGCAAARERLDAVLDGWARDVPSTCRLVILGDDVLRRELGDARVWSCVEAGGPDDSYRALPRKVLAGLRRARDEEGWDFVFKCDDDTFAVPERVQAVLDEFSPDDEIFTGATDWEAESTRADFAHLQHWGPPFRFRYFSGGGGYALSRPAIDRAWPQLLEALDTQGGEDALLAAALHRAGVPFSPPGRFFDQYRVAEQLLFGPRATIHLVSPADQSLFRTLRRMLPPEPFHVVRAQVGWGEVGLGGRMGYEDREVRVGGELQRQAISAHAPSTLTLRLPPGLLFELRGALNDSSDPGHRAKVEFFVRDRQGALLAELGRARPGRPSARVRVVVPDDGRLVLEATTDAPTACHSVWLWNAFDWDPKTPIL